jgi:hypothetical protein
MALTGRYGLGIIHHRQEKYAIAEGHFRNAVKINPCSPVLLCYQGMVQHAQKKSRAALEMLTQVPFTPTLTLSFSLSLRPSHTILF